jgi:hypothetical protein
MAKERGKAQAIRDFRKFTDEPLPTGIQEAPVLDSGRWVLRMAQGVGRQDCTRFRVVSGIGKRAPETVGKTA